MNDNDQAPIGALAWTDLTVANAEDVQEFYSSVVGWGSEPVEMGEYRDFNMTLPGSGEATAGICHARGENANLPAQWLIYITVEDVDASAQRCAELGGRVIDGPRTMGAYRLCVIEDPAGAVAALIAQ